tara:strand:- start:440 stop:664 length:225 start_codon:yes stop_codon:yes gene_type:complete
MDFEEYFKKMCGTPTDNPSSSFKVNATTTPFNKKELRWLKDQLESCIEWSDKKNTSKYLYTNMLKKVKEQLEIL